MSDPVSIIGASGALGHGLALRLATAGVPVVAGSRDAGRATETAERLRAAVPSGSFEGFDNAAAAGKAVVATPRAAEGVDAIDGEHLLVADGEDALVEALVALLLDRPRRRRLAQSARRWAESSLGWDQGVAAFQELYDTVVSAR